MFHVFFLVWIGFKILWKPPSETWDGKKEIHPAIRFLQYSNKAVFVLRLSWISNTFDFVFEKIRLDLNTNMKIAFSFQPFFNLLMFKWKKLHFICDCDNTSKCAFYVYSCYHFFVFTAVVKIKKFSFVYFAKSQSLYAMQAGDYARIKVSNPSGRETFSVNWQLSTVQLWLIFKLAQTFIFFSWHCRRKRKSWQRRQHSCHKSKYTFGANSHLSFQNQSKLQSAFFSSTIF